MVILIDIRVDSLRILTPQKPKFRKQEKLQNLISTFYKKYYTSTKRKRIAKKDNQRSRSTAARKRIAQRKIRDHVAQQQVEQKERRINHGNQNNGYCSCSFLSYFLQPRYQYRQRIQFSFGTLSATRSTR